MIFRYASMRSAVRICCWDAEDRSGASSRLLGTFFLAGSHVLNGSVFKGLFLTRKPLYFIGKSIISGEVFPLNQSIDQHGSTSQCHKMQDFVSGHVAAMQPSHLEIQGSYGIRYPVSACILHHIVSLLVAAQVSQVRPLHDWRLVSRSDTHTPGRQWAPVCSMSAAWLESSLWQVFHLPYGSIRIHTVSPCISRFYSLYSQKDS